MKKNYDPKSEEIFNTTWDLTEDENYLSNDEEINDDIVKIYTKIYQNWKSRTLLVKKTSLRMTPSSTTSNKKIKMILSPQYHVLPS